MIPKIIHYCWFGGKPKPEYAEKCIRSWQKYLPDYEIKEWNETNSDLSHPFVLNALRFKMWAFIADFVRVRVLRDFGGIYLDTDILFIRPLPYSFLALDAFAGSENGEYVSAGIIGAKKGSLFIEKLYKFYEKQGQVIDYHQFIIPRVITWHVLQIRHPLSKIEKISDLTVFPPAYFYPLPLDKKKEAWEAYLQPESICVHLWGGSWLEKQELSWYENRRKKKLTYLSRKWRSVVRKSKKLKAIFVGYVRRIFKILRT